MAEHRAILYVRQSLTRDGSASLDAQESDLRQHCDARGYRVVGVVRDESQRGWQEDRPGLAELQRRAASDEFDLVLIWHSDRLARKLVIAEGFVDAMERLGIAVESMKEEYFGSPMFRQIIGAINEQMSRDLQRRMRSIVTFKVQEGKHQGPPPWGFVRGDDDHLVPHPDTVDAVAAMFRWRLEGYGRHRIRNQLAVEYGIILDPASIGRALRNPAYAGGVRGPGRLIVWDAHEGIVSRDTWEAVQRARAERPKPPRSSAPHWLEGYAFCGCGSPLYRAETRPGYWVLRCGASLDRRTCRNPVKGIALERAARFVRARFGADLAAVAAMLPADAVRAMVARRAGGDTNEGEHRRLLQRRERALLRRERILEQRADGLISREACRVKVEAIDAEIGEVEGKIAAGPAPIDAAAVGRAIGAARDVAGVIARLDGDGMRTALARVEARLVIGEGGPVLSYQEPFAGLVGAATDDG